MTPEQEANIQKAVEETRARHKIDVRGGMRPGFVFLQCTCGWMYGGLGPVTFEKLEKAFTGHVGWMATNLMEYGDFKPVQPARIEDDSWDKL